MSEAERLADLLERDPSEWGGLSLGWKAAAELRRLAALEQQRQIEAQGVPDGWAPTDAELTEIYKKANGEDVGKAQPLTTQRIFKAMRAMLAFAPPAPQASVVQQEPVAWRTFDGEGGYEYRDFENNEDYAAEWVKRNPKRAGWVEPLYTHPAQQAKPQPLSDEQIKSAVYKQCPDFDKWHEGPSIDDMIAIVKAAHGIQGS